MKQNIQHHIYRCKGIFLVIVLLLMSFTLHAEQNYIMGSLDPNDQSRIVTQLPAILAYFPESQIIFTKNDGQIELSNLSYRAVAKIGTLVLSGWNTGTEVSASSTFNRKIPENNYLHQLFMGYGANGDSADSPENNTVTVTYYIKGQWGLTASFTAGLYSVAHCDTGTVTTSINRTDGRNPRLLSKSGSRLYENQSIDLYLVSDVLQTYNALSLLIDTTKPLTISTNGGMRNLFQWVYRLNNKDDRYYTGTILQDPMETLLYNGNMRFDAEEDFSQYWFFSVFPNYTAENLQEVEGLKQTVADMTLMSETPFNTNKKPTFTITDDSQSGDKKFYLRRVNEQDDTYTASDPIWFKVYVDIEHREGAADKGFKHINKGDENTWFFPAGETISNAKLAIEIKDSLKGIDAGLWRDTLTITITPPDD